MTAIDVDRLMDGIDNDYDEFIAKDDHIISGRKTIEVINDFEWYYANQTVTVVTTNKDFKSRHPIQLFHGDVKSFVEGLKRSGGSDIWLLGGGEMVKTFLQEDLLDEMMIFVHPILLGEGILLFPQNFNRVDWNLKECTGYSNIVVLMHYVRR